MNDNEQVSIGPNHPPEQAPESVPEIIPVMPLNNVVLFPFMIAPVMVVEERTKRLVEEALVGERVIGMFTIPPEAEEAPAARSGPKTLELSARQSPVNVYATGTAATILRMLKIPDGAVRLLVHGIHRIGLEEMVQTEPYFKARIRRLQEIQLDDKETQAMMKSAQGMLHKMVEMSALPEDMLVAAMNLNDPGKFSDMIVSNLQLKTRERQEGLEILNVKERLRHTLEILNRELEMLQIGSKIQSQVQTTFDKSQRDYFLREQMKAIRHELGETEETPVEIKELRERIDEAKLPEKAKEVAEREAARLGKMHPGSPEYTVSMTYLDWILALPWSKSTRDNYDLKKAAKILDEDHYGLEKVKERILEHLAVIKLRKRIRGPILCFVGPPGVGKTSLGKSIARALGRKFYRFSVGGMRDEAEIRGHRRTYIGSMPGRIIKGLRDCVANNPVIMLDEIDKLGADYRGDPASALLETLDPEQNYSFTDNYLDMPFDLSKVMFITTANILDTIPAPLQDRMEILRLAGYTTDEKMKIARKYLIPKRMEAAGVSENNLEFKDDAVLLLIESYTREAGLRNVEREIASICQKVARKIAEGQKKKVTVMSETVEKLLGPPKVFHETAMRAGVPGVATGLAWTPMGGELLFIETVSTPGNGRLTLTGQLGDVMKESVQAALSYLHSNQRELKLPEIAFTRGNFHVHVPAGATPKDGPSAGVATCAALYSLLRDVPLPTDTAMTGELTLSGKVLPIGGLKEKVLAAHRAGIKRVIAPKQNEKDLEEIPEAARDGIRFVWAETIDDVLREVFPSARSGDLPRRPGQARRHAVGPALRAKKTKRPSKGAERLSQRSARRAARKTAGLRARPS